MSETTAKSSIISTPVAILIAGIFISVAVLYSNGDLPFINKDKSSKSGNTEMIAEGPYSKYIKLASTLDLDGDKFKACMEKQDTAEITKDMADAQAAGASGTPAFFVGRRVENNSVRGISIFGAYPLTSFEEIVAAFKTNDDAKILEATNALAALAGGTPFASLDEALTTVSLDDDPKEGSDSADVVIVEFSDYECPFCKRHVDQTYPSLKSKLIDSGQVQLVFRDLPLSFHDPVATQAAVAANCAREQGGDASYFKYHDAYFKSTQTNGKGLL